MLNRLSSVLQSAADALAPPPPPLEDLKYHWKMVMRFYAQRTIQSRFPIEETNIPSHLEQLLKILIAEDTSTKASTDGSCTSAGPCLEFLLQHRLLELLVSLARADSPPGMRRYLLGYLRRLVTSISPHLLTLASIHLPLLRIVVLCSQSKASPTEAEEIEYLLALCQIIHRQPYLSIIFNKETKPSQGSGSSSSVCSTALPVSSPTQEHSPVKNSEEARKQVDQGRSSPGTINIQQFSSESEILKTVSNSVTDELLKNPTSDRIDQMLKEGSKRNESDPSSAQNIGDNRKPSDQSLSASLVTENNVLPNRQEKNSDSDGGRNEKGCNYRQDEVFGDRSRTTSGSCTPEPFPIEDLSETEIIEGSIPLLDAVLSFINSPDSGTKLHVCEAILMLVSVADDTFSSAIARTSNLGLVMAEKLTSSFQEIPADIDPDHFEDIPQNWGPNNSQLWLEHHAFPGCRLVASFVSWLNFCDQLTVESPYEVAESVAAAVRALFFEIELESELRTGDAVRQQLITNIVSLSLRHISSTMLLSEVYAWLMGDMTEDGSESQVLSLRQLLLNNCLHSEINLSRSSMRLFELLLESCDEQVLNFLVMRYLNRRAYYDTSTHHDKSSMESWSDEEDARELEGVKINRGEDSSGLSSRTFAPRNIHKIIDSFLQLLPSSLRSSTDYQESGYHQYIAEAQRQYTTNVQMCSTMHWGTEATFQEEEEETETNQPFTVGPFLQMIFERLRGLPQQPYEMNLQLTALVSRLAMLPHPYLHEFLLNPLLPLVPGTTSLYSTLQAVAKEMQTALAGIPNCKKTLVRTRQELLGDMSYHHDSTRESSCLFESVVVLEEFNKELAAIAYVKYHHHS
ncbi:Protein FAM160B1 [Frankliniella fusca]|uniref:Protein FAM160B1 n=1 Tax=Frankliniella fusca TaxID=407009 RepID=A0AAE1H4D1_9NEOP|nr:Protein FAM160B1 [Frankliniella fusca]